MNAIKQRRAELGLTQQKMSDLTGIPIRTIQDWENERRTPPAWTERLVLQDLDRIEKELNDK